MDITKETYVPVMENENIIATNNKILLYNNTTSECVYVPLTERIIKEFNLNVVSQNQEVGTGCESNSDNEEHAKLWKKENTLFLIDCIKKYDKEFSVGIKKNVWDKVALQCKSFNKNITSKQCETKWKTLKRTYKSVLLHNNTSGKKPKYWEFFSIIHEFMHKKPEINPPATCSNIAGLQVNEDMPSTSIGNVQTPESSISHRSSPDNNFIRKRKLKQNEADRRHKEKMERLDRFNDLFEKMIDKM